MEKISGKWKFRAGESDGGELAQRERKSCMLFASSSKPPIAFLRFSTTASGKRAQLIIMSLDFCEMAAFIKSAVGFTRLAASKCSFSVSHCPKINDGNAFPEGWFCADPVIAFCETSRCLEGMNSSKERVFLASEGSRASRLISILSGFVTMQFAMNPIPGVIQHWHSLSHTNS